MNTILVTLEHHWLLSLIVGGGICGEISDSYRRHLKRRDQRAELAHRRQVELETIRAAVAQARAGRLILPTVHSSDCSHGQAEPVQLSTGEVVAWLCPACDTELPATFASLKEAA